MNTANPRRQQQRGRGLIALAIILPLIGGFIAGINAPSTSTRARSQAWESIFTGLAWAFGAPHPAKQAGFVWTGRAIILAGLILAGWLLWKRFGSAIVGAGARARGDGRTENRQAAPGPMMPTPQQGQTQPGPQPWQAPGQPSGPTSGQPQAGGTPQGMPNPFNQP